MYRMNDGVIVLIGLSLVMKVAEDLLWDGLRYIDCEQGRWWDGLRPSRVGLLTHCGYAPVVDWLILGGSLVKFGVAGLICVAYATFRDTLRISDG